VLVVEDEESFSDALSYMLRKEGFEVAVCPTGPDALETFDRSGADLVLLDLMLPGLPGSEVCRNLRERSNVPVIMLTAKDSEIDKVVGLELGADDYVTKPFSSRELVARMRAVLRRRGDADEPAASILESGPVRMDVDRHVVTVRGGQVQLPLKEFELLEVLLRNSGRVLTRMQLIDRVWGADYVGDTKTLDVHVKRIGLPETTLGLVPAWGGARLVVLVLAVPGGGGDRRRRGRRGRRGERRVGHRGGHHRDAQPHDARVLEGQHGIEERAAGHGPGQVAQQHLGLRAGQQHGGVRGQGHRAVVGQLDGGRAGRSS
jgi:two-component system response regulator RegX3